MAAVKKEFSASRAECAALRWCWDEILSKLKVSEAEIGVSLKAVSERTTEGSTLMSK